MEERVGMGCARPEKGEGFLHEQSLPDVDQMRRFIVDTAWSIQDEKLLRMLYIRAKTLKNL